MAPEQRESAAVTAAVDQYALGVALREAVPTPPKWIAEIIARATAEAPAGRFASMTALADALGRDPARVLRRRLAVAGALGLAGATFAIGMAARGDETAHCVGADAEIAAAWNPEVAAATRAHLVALGPYGAQVADRAGAALDSYAKQWAATHTAACRAHDRGELTPALYNTSLACLLRAKTSLVTARDVLENTTRERLDSALVATQSLPAAERCRTETEEPPPAAIADAVAANANAVARAHVLALAVDPRAIETAAKAAQEADAIGYAREIGRASLVHGLALALQQRRSDAVPVFTHATASALEADDNATAIESLARRLYAIGIGDSSVDQADAELAKLELALPIAKGLTGRDAFARALLYNNLGTLYLALQKRPTARTWFLEGLRIRPPTTPETYELASLPGNLGLVEPDAAARDKAFAAEHAELVAAVGEDHPRTLETTLRIAMVTADAKTAADRLAAVCDRYRRLHPHLKDKISVCSFEIAWLADDRGDTQAAHDALVGLAPIGVNEGLLIAGYRDLLAGGAPGPIARDMAALATKLGAQSHFWAHWRSVDAWLVAALAAERAGDSATARGDIDKALAALDGLGDWAKQPFAERRRTRLLAMRARLTAPR
jgi:hypothetical protein